MPKVAVAGKSHPSPSPHGWGPAVTFPLRRAGSLTVLPFALHSPEQEEEKDGFHPLPRLGADLAAEGEPG